LYGNGSPAGGTRQALLQGVELGRAGSNGIFAVGSTWTLSFWIKGGAGESIGVGTSFRADPGTSGPSGEEIGQTIPLTPTWTKHSLTWTVGTTVDAADTCLAVTFFNSVASASAVLITGVQLEPGPVATPFEHRPIGTELALCQRYYQKSTDDLRLFLAAAAPSTAKYISQPRPVVMRATPTETGTVTAGTISLSGTAKTIRVSANGINESLASNLQNYTADAEL
jgi:hypothetical protein